MQWAGLSPLSLAAQNTALGGSAFLHVHQEVSLCLCNSKTDRSNSEGM